MNYSRARFLKFFLITLIAALSVRLAYLATAKRAELGGGAARQQEVRVTLESLRGDIYDRNMRPLTCAQEYKGVVSLPGMVEDLPGTARLLSGLCGISPDEALERLTSPIPGRFEFLTGKSLPRKVEGLEPFTTRVRYDESSVARHVVGYLNSGDGSGAAGIEKGYNRTLEQGRSHQLSFVGDALRRILPGLGVTASSEVRGMGVRLTLDYALQAEVERIANQSMECGAALVADISTGDILALLSRPEFDQNNIKQYIDGGGTQLMNRALCAYDMGSVFKIVTAAAAIEARTDLYTPKYECTGGIEAAGAVIGCHKEEGHGLISLWDGFVLSCNPAFIEAGLNIGGRRVVNMAGRLGFGRKIGLFEGAGESDGYLPVSPKEGDTANLAIGQGKLLGTPLQVLDMTLTVANGGVRKRLNLIDGIVDESGNAVSRIKYRSDERVLSEGTAQLLREMMHDVTEHGTGTNAQLEDIGGAGGKTGSAQTGWREGDEDGAHAWFTGFYPAESPRYAITILVEHGKGGNAAAAPIFSRLARFLDKRD